VLVRQPKTAVFQSEVEVRIYCMPALKVLTQFSLIHFEFIHNMHIALLKKFARNTVLKCEFHCYANCGMCSSLQSTVLCVVYYYIWQVAF